MNSKKNLKTLRANSIVPIISAYVGVLHMKCLENLPDKEKWKRVLRLQRQFSHASKEKLVKLVKESTGTIEPELEKMIRGML